MFREIAVIAPGAMGSAVGRRLVENGVRVITLLEGRSAASRKRAEAAGMIGVEAERIAGAEAVLSIVPPAEALPLARSLAPVFKRGGNQPVFVDCNAVDARTVIEAAGIIEASGARFADAGIIGGPPKPGDRGPTFYISGEAGPDLAPLAQAGLHVRIIDGPVGKASSLKMAYAGITKGLTGIAAAMIVAASRAGVADLLHAELAESQTQLLARFGKALPDMYPKAYRWVGEMREIGAFGRDDGATERLYQALGDLYQGLADDYGGDRTVVSAIEAFLALPAGLKDG